MVYKLGRSVGRAPHFIFPNKVLPFTCDKHLPFTHLSKLDTHFATLNTKNHDRQSHEGGSKVGGAKQGVKVDSESRKVEARFEVPTIVAGQIQA
jgi:hypothetical protein